tara:strand:- start:21188 stop:22570 length:1383 start_codon:yes stop_codon:yes gene_type:complete
MGARITAIVCLTLVASVVSLAGNSMAEGEDIIVESNLTWMNDMDLSQNVRVVNGGSLTLTGIEISISDGIEIFVDAESSITVQSAILKSNNTDDENPGDGEGYTIVVDGKMEARNSTINGAGISTSGSLYINDTALEKSGPVILEADESSIYLGGKSSFSNSSDGHDIKSRAFSTINWGEEVTGSGGDTNKWERRLAGQNIVFDAVFVTYEITGMYQKEVYTNYSNQDGVSFIDGGKERVVEIAWSDDNTLEINPIWTEKAIVTVTEYRTAWNPVESGIGNYGGGQFELLWDTTVLADSGTPEIGWESITPLDEEGVRISEASIGESVNIEAVIANSGTAAASLAIGCELSGTGESAQISPSFPNTVVAPGGQATISFSWRSSNIGEEALSCRILTPTQLVDEMAFGGGMMTSGTLAWQEGSSDNDAESTLIPAVVALLFGAAIGGYLLFSIYQEQEFED